MWYAAILLIGVDLLPDSLPDALPDAVAPVAKQSPAPIVNDPLRILRYEQRCQGGVCTLIPVFAEVEPDIDAAAKRLENWKQLPADEVKRLAGIVDAPAVRKALRQEYSVGTCGMAIGCHGSILLDVFEDGTKEPAAEQPAGNTPSGGRWRQVEYPIRRWKN
jgi:hypothetical protein